MSSLAKTAIPAFEATSTEAITSHVERLRATYRSGKTKDVQFRLRQLRKLYWAIVDNEALMAEALRLDMGKSKHEAYLTEIDWVKRECMDFIKNLETWLQDEKIVNVPSQFFAMKMRTRLEPLGIILIISAYNYPFMMNITPIIGALAAGNCCVVKPSELSPNSAMVLKKIVEEGLDPGCAVAINGFVEQTSHLLDLKSDKILFTGGTKVGTIVAKKAAETLTPVLLELGGRNPAFVTKNADVKLAARRLLWAKFLNAGQVCLSQNYILVERSVLSDFIGAMQATYRSYAPQGAKASSDLSRIVNKQYFDRIKKMLDNTKGKIVLGGATDEDSLFIEPTAVLVDDINDSMMAEESFGPVWSVMAFDTVEQAIEIANSVDPTPLALSTFGSDVENEKIINGVTSGGATINDSFFHASSTAAPFGGVGTSGMGNFHGYYSLKAFSHQRTMAKVPSWTDKLIAVRYMPYSSAKLARLQKMTIKKPDFDREGNVIRGLGYWVGLVFSLGGSGPKGALARWGVLFALAAALKLKKVY